MSGSAGWAEMHIAFVDESGDVGLRNSPTRHFVLCAAVVDHVHWAAVNAELRAMRGRLLAAHGLRADAEIHASEFLGGSPLHLGLGIRERFRCAYHILRVIGNMQGLSFARIAILKDPAKDDTLDVAWETLLANTASRLTAVPHRACSSTGLLVICDHNSISPYRPREGLAPLLGPHAKLLDLPFGRDSADSQLLQVADLLAFLTKQFIEPNNHFRRQQGRALVRRANALLGLPCAS